MLYEAEGVVEEVMDTQTFESGFQKRSIVLTIGDKFPRPISFEFKKDKVSLLDEVKKGDKVTITFGLDGREWDNPKSGKKQYFVSLEGVKLNGGSGASEGKRSVPKPATPPPSVSFDDTDDMPF